MNGHIVIAFCLILFVPAIRTKRPQCRFRLHTAYHTQEFTSLNYPKLYPNSLRCIWLLIAPRNGQVELTIVDLATEEYYDFVEVRDGDTDNSTLLLSFSGTSKLTSTTFTSSSGRLYVKFTSDRSVAERGFKVTYRTVLPVQVNITTVIQSQFAETSWSTQVINRDNVTREIPFQVLLPLNAYVTSFEMRSSGVTYKGVLEIKREAFLKYDDAKRRLITTPYVNGLKISLNRFFASFNALPGKSVTFLLRYQELLTLARHRYTYKAFAPRQDLFSDIRLDIYLCAKSHIDFMRLLPVEINPLRRKQILSTAFPNGFSVARNGSFAHIAYRPPVVRDPAPHGGVFELQYNVTRPAQSGRMYLHDGYYVNDLAPPLPHIGRRIVFVLDISGSMAGVKIEQVRTAVNNFLQGLDEKVLLNIVLFESVVRVWKTRDGLVPLTSDNKASAMKFMMSLDPDGGTNINDALKTGLRLLQQGVDLKRRRVHDHKVRGFDSLPHRFVVILWGGHLRHTTEYAGVEHRHNRTYIHPTTDYIIFLTDGKPTLGPRSSAAILNIVGRTNKAGYGIYSIGFGQNVDTDFLKELSGRNGGTWLQIFENADADEQIHDYIATLAAPILTDVSFSYPSGHVNRSNSLSYSVLRSGEELLVAGVLSRSANLSHGNIIPITLSGNSDAGQSVAQYDLLVKNATPCSELNAIRKVTNVPERTFALLRLKELNTLLETAGTGDEKRQYRKEILRLTLRYGFVTQVAALVVRDDIGENQDPTPAPVQPLAEPIVPRSLVVAPSPPPLVVPKNPPTSPSSTETSRQNAKENIPWIFEGDPHFIIKLHDDLRVCFTWGGMPGKSYNLLEDPEHDISVHGLISWAPPRPEDERKNNTITCPNKLPETYFSQLAFHYKKVAFVVTPHNLTILNGSDDKQMRKSFLCASDDEITVDSALTHVKIYDITRTHSMVNVTLKGIATFVINLHRVRDRLILGQTKPMGDHLDLVVDGTQRFSSRSDGLFGDFLSNSLRRDFKKSSIIERNHHHILRYGKRRLEVTETDMTDPTTPHGTLDCYFLCETESFLGKNSSEFHVPSLLRAKFEGPIAVMRRNYVT